MEIVKTFDNLIEIRYNNKREQVEHLGSLGVYLEDPIYFRKVMETKEIKKKNRPVLQYYGFNFSSKELEEYVSKNSNSTEAKLLDTLNNRMDTDNYYIISYVKKDESTYNHEMAHYEFWNDSKIQSKIEKLTHKGHYDTLIKNLEKLGYHKSVINTEIYAFSKVFENTLPNNIKKDLHIIRKNLFE